MLKLERPEKPKNLEQRSQKALKELNEPGTSNWPKWNDSFWQNLKNHFDKAQNQKCGYCERDISGYGDVEHYRPKKLIQRLDEDGTESINSKKLTGRSTPNITQQGYWWLAYEWDNYLLACEICNRTFKRALFPVNPHRPLTNNPKIEKAPNPKKSDLTKEKPLLINPFEKDLDPYIHFKYEKNGTIKARNKDPRGESTIRVCGLWRESLRKRRSLQANPISDNSNWFLQVTPGSDLHKNLATTIYFHGLEIYPFAGMTRIIFKQETNWEWSDLEKMVKKAGWMPKVDELIRDYQGEENI